MSIHQTYFSDVSCLGKIRLSGASAPEFVKVMTTVEPSSVETPGKAARALILNAEGCIIDLVTLSRTGELEYMLVSSSETVDELTEWLQAHAQLTTIEGAPVFRDIQVENTTSRIATFALHGPHALAILGELCAADLAAELGGRQSALITIGQLQVLLLRWSFLCASDQCITPAAKGGQGEVFEVYLPAQAAEDFKQILFGFEEIDQESFEEYVSRRYKAHTWFASAEQAAYSRPETAGLTALLRVSSDFVGARALGLPKPQ